MTQVSYLIAIAASKMDIELTLAILNTAGMGQAFYGFSNGMIWTDLWIIPKGKSTREEVLERLQALPNVNNVSVIDLSNPVLEKQLEEVRDLFTIIGWNVSDLTNEALSLFINAKVAGQLTYYIDHEHKTKGDIKITIRPIEEHPDFSPDWLKAIPLTEQVNPERELTTDDLQTTSISLTSKGNKPSQRRNNKK